MHKQLLWHVKYLLWKCSRSIIGSLIAISCHVNSLDINVRIFVPLYGSLSSIVIPEVHFPRKEKSKTLQRNAILSLVVITRWKTGRKVSPLIKDVSLKSAAQSWVQTGTQGPLAIHGELCVFVKCIHFIKFWYFTLLRYLTHTFTCPNSDESFLRNFVNVREFSFFTLNVQFLLYTSSLNS